MYSCPITHLSNNSPVCPITDQNGQVFYRDKRNRCAGHEVVTSTRTGTNGTFYPLDIYANGTIDILFIFRRHKQYDVINMNFDFKMEERMGYQSVKPKVSS